MENIKFNTVTELYQRIYPALTIKKNSINSLFKSNIKEIEIWDYFKNNVWKREKKLELCDIVNNILNDDDTEIYFSIKKSRQGI